MGNDGGSIPKRRELVKEAARAQTAAEEKATRHEQQQYHWTTDPISQQPLTEPIVSDAYGKLYNKDTILEFLVQGERKEDGDAATHGSVKSFKDVVEVKFERDGDHWKCPITGDRLGPGSKAVYLVPCGHAFSGNTIKEVSGEKCLTCDTSYASNDIIPILPTTDVDIARLTLRLKTLQEKGLSHSLKKASSNGKKRKKRDPANEPSDENCEKENDKTPHENGKSDRETVKSKLNAAINNTSTASLTAKVLEEGEAAKKRRRENDNVRSLFSSREQGRSMANSADFMTRGYSVPNTAKR